MNLLESLDRLPHPRLLVLGDLMLDRYTWGRTNRTSQEAPVLVLQAERQEHRLGGASNVACMARALEADVTCLGVVGDDEPGRCARNLLHEVGIVTDELLVTSHRPTTLKERFCGRAGSGVSTQMLRVDHEVTTPIERVLEDQLISRLVSLIPQHSGVLISDYAKGVCTPRVLSTAISVARHHHVPVLVDPGRGVELAAYRGATLVKPNRIETELATGTKVVRADDALRAGRCMCEQFDLAMSVITLDSDGMALIERDGTAQVFPTRARSVYDITGAGDMVLAMLGLSLGGGLEPAIAVQLANAAAGLEVDRTGVATLTRDEIRRELTAHQLNSHRKIMGRAALQRDREELRRRGQAVVLTNGCFDLLHVGHVTYLEQAAALGDVLIVAINSDASVRRLKGPQRPVIKEEERAAMLAALGCVDRVVIFDEDTPHALLHAIRPDILIKGGTYQPHEVVGHEIVEAYGGRVEVAGVVPGVSTTQIVQKVQQRSSWRQAG